MPDINTLASAEEIMYIDSAHHADNQRRFVEIEKSLEFNTSVTQSLSVDMTSLRRDTSELVEMWKDASVVFKWLRVTGAVLIWLGKVGTGVAVVWAAWKYGPPGK